MEHSENDAAVKDARVKLREEECAEGTEHIKICKKNQLRLDHNLR